MRTSIKIFHLYTLVFAFSSFLTAQTNSQIKRTSHWFFGGNAGLDFTTGTAVADTSGQMDVYAGCSTMSDTLGDLLMYTDGQSIWNKNHQLMPNGTGLLGLGTPVQSSVIVPKPLDANLYYIFTCAGYDGSSDGIRYSIVDMSLDGGQGDVTLKNKLLFKPSSEQLGATMHANCTDVWIMGHETNSNKYRAYLLTANGIDTNNVVINDIGNFPKIFNTYGTGLKFSPNGKKVAAVNYWDNLNNPTYNDTLELFDFDNATGNLSNLIKISDTVIFTFAFSPNSKLLYITNYHLNIQTIPGFEEVFQYDVSSGISSMIQSSRTLVYQLMYDNDFSDYQIGIDNILYAANPLHDSISVIRNPNVQGVGCLAQELVISLNGKTSYIGLPNFVSSYFNQDTASCFYQTGVIDLYSHSIQLVAKPNPFNISTTISFFSSNLLPNNINIALYDVLGNKIKQIDKSSISNHNDGFYEFTINKDNMNAGIYFIKLFHQNQNYTQKLIITN